MTTSAYPRLSESRSDARTAPDFLGLSSREMEKYDLTEWIERKVAASDDRQTSLVDECTTEIRRKVGATDIPHPCAVRVPREILAQRAMVPATGSKGGYAIGSQVGFIEGFYAANVALELGMRTVDGLEGNVAFGRVKSGVNVAWLGTNGVATASEPVFGQVSATPRTAVALEEVPLSLLRQTGPDGQNFLLNDLGLALGEAVGEAAIAGAGGSEPIGVVNIQGVGSEVGTSITWSKTIDMMADVHAAGGVKNRATAGWAGAPTTEALLRKRERATGSGFIWDDDAMAGRRALVSNAVPANALIYGDWSQLVLVNWGGLEIVVNNRYSFNTGAAGIRAVWYCDIIARNPASFSISTSIT